MEGQKGKRCATCRYAKDPTIMKVYEIEVKYMTCWRDLPHVYKPCNTCNLWKPKEDVDGQH